MRLRMTFRDNPFKIQNKQKQKDAKPEPERKGIIFIVGYVTFHVLAS
jgi:hypothetical protein